MNYKWITLSNTTIGTLMASLDRNIILIALPTIASDLHTSFFTLMWIVLVYWLVTAAVLLNFGRLSDMFGRVKLYNMGFALLHLAQAYAVYHKLESNWYCSELFKHWVQHSFSLIVLQ